MAVDWNAADWGHGRVHYASWAADEHDKTEQWAEDAR